MVQLREKGCTLRWQPIDVLEVRAAAGQDIHLLLGRSAPTADSLCGLAMASGEPLLSDNLAKDETGWQRTWAPA